jgi:hypothetical protein
MDTDAIFRFIGKLPKVVIESLRKCSCSYLAARFGLLGTLILSACNSAPTPKPDGQTDVLPTIVAATLTARVTSATNTKSIPETTEPSKVTTATATFTDTPEPTVTLTPSPTLIEKNVLGKICFPGSDIPAMTAYFEETSNETIVELPIKENQTSYEVNLQPGTYIAYAWLEDFSRGGLYSRAVACGLKAGCDDHTYLPFIVTGRKILSDIDLCDWFAGPFNVPYPPNIEQGNLTGNVSGNIINIDGDIPAMRVVAFNIKTNYFYWVHTLSGQNSYTINELPPGSYHLVAYDEQGRTGGHTDAGHNLIEVLVKVGKTTDGVNINDWNAPPGALPPDPTQQ